MAPATAALVHCCRRLERTGRDGKVDGFERDRGAGPHKSASQYHTRCVILWPAPGGKTFAEELEPSGGRAVAVAMRRALDSMLR